MSNTGLKRRKTGVSTAVAVSDEDDSIQFYNDCMGLYSDKIGQLNSFYLDRINQCHQPSMLEYLRIEKITKRMYNPYVGLVYITGSNETLQHGREELPNDHRTTSLSPVLDLGKNLQIKQTACGGLHSVGVSREGYVYSWGDETSGALGRTGDQRNPNKPYRVRNLIPSKNSFFHVPVENEDNCIVSVAAGNTMSLFLSIHGTVYSTGTYRSTDDDQFHDITPPDQTHLQVSVKETKGESPMGSRALPVQVLLPERAKFISCGATYCAVITNSHKLLTWGVEAKGETGRGTTEKEAKSLLISKNVPNKPVLKKLLTPSPPIWPTKNKMHVMSVSCGTYHMMVVARPQDGPDMNKTLLYGCGNNAYGQLGLGHHDDKNTLQLVEMSRGLEIIDVACGSHHTLVRDIHCSAIYACGRGDKGQLGTIEKPEHNAYANTLERVLFDSPHLFKSIACGDESSYAVTFEGLVYSWGFGESGALGIGKESDANRPTKMKLPKGMRALEVEAGGHHATAILVNPK